MANLNNVSFKWNPLGPEWVDAEWLCHYGRWKRSNANELPTLTFDSEGDTFFNEAWERDLDSPPEFLVGPVPGTLAYIRVRAES